MNPRTNYFSKVEEVGHMLNLYRELYDKRIFMSSYSSCMFARKLDASTQIRHIVLSSAKLQNSRQSILSEL